MLTIRDATVDDVPAMLRMLEDSACDQGFEGEVGVTAEDLRLDGFGANPRFRSIIADWNGERAGMALFFFIYSSWGSKTVLYLEDLFVGSEFRGRGIAKSLLAHLARIAKANGCRRCQWVVHSENIRAINVYKATGAQVLDDWRLVSLKDGAIDLLIDTTTSAL